MVMFKDGHQLHVVSNVKILGWVFLALVTDGPDADSGARVYLHGGLGSHELPPAIMGEAQGGDGHLKVNEEGKPVAVYVDELAFWNKALSAEEVGVLFNSYL